MLSMLTMNQMMLLMTKKQKLWDFKKDNSYEISMFHLSFEDKSQEDKIDRDE